MKAIEFRIFEVMPEFYGFGTDPVHVVGLVCLPTTKYDLPRYALIRHVYSEPVPLPEIPGCEFRSTRAEQKVTERFGVLIDEMRAHLANDAFALYVRNCRREVDQLIAKRGLTMEDILDEQHTTATGTSSGAEHREATDGGVREVEADGEAETDDETGGDDGQATGVQRR